MIAYNIKNSNLLNDSFNEYFEFSFFKSPLIYCLKTLDKDNIDYRTYDFLKWLKIMSNVLYTINRIDEPNFLNVQTENLIKLKDYLQSVYKEDDLEKEVLVQIEDMQKNLNLNNQKGVNNLTKNALSNLKLLNFMKDLDGIFFQEKIKETLAHNKKILKVKKSYLIKIEKYLNGKIELPELNVELIKDDLTEFKELVENEEYFSLEVKKKVWEFLGDFKNISINEDSNLYWEKFMTVIEEDLNIQNKIMTINEESNDKEKFEVAKDIYKIIKKCFKDLGINETNILYLQDSLREYELLSLMKKEDISDKITGSKRKI